LGDENTVIYLSVFVKIRAQDAELSGVISAIVAQLEFGDIAGFRTEKNSVAHSRKFTAIIERHPAPSDLPLPLF
jgi:hypothetical protein